MNSDDYIIYYIVAGMFFLILVLFFMIRQKQKKMQLYHESLQAELKNIRNETSKKEAINKNSQIFRTSVQRYYEKCGYTVKSYEGDDKEYRIHFIAMKDNKIELVQCNSWSKAGQYKMDYKNLYSIWLNQFKFIINEDLIKPHMKLIIRIIPKYIEVIDDSFKNGVYNFKSEFIKRGIKDVDIFYNTLEQLEEKNYLK